MFSGKSVAIVAGGPSLKGFDFGRLSHSTVVAINRAHENLPGASMLWWSDMLFWVNHKDAIAAHGAPVKATVDWDYPADMLPPGVSVYRVTGRAGYDPAPGCIRHGNNSAYAAIHATAQRGARKIVIFGLDMRYGPDGESHYHGGHGKVHEERTLTEDMLPFFETLAGPLAKLGLTIINASPNSAVTCWPRCSIEEGLVALMTP